MTGTRQTLPGGRHRAGAAGPPQSGRPFRPSRTGRPLLAGGIAAAPATGGLLVAQTASAAPTDAVPSFPDNIVVFPDRDFVSVEGYEAHAGETARIDVIRGTEVT